MFEIFAQEAVITALLFTCMAISLFLRILLGTLYRNMIKEADNMASTNNKMLKQCKLKFAHCYQLSNGVANISVFVDKFISRLRLGRLSFNMMYHLSGQAMLLSVVFSGAGICKSIAKGKTLGDILPFYIVSLLGLYLYFSVSAVMDIRGKRRILKVNLVDYLENHLAPRIHVTKQDIEMLYGEDFDGGRRGVAKSSGGEQAAKSAARKNRRTVELMPIKGRLTPEEKRDLMWVADDFSIRPGNESTKEIARPQGGEKEAPSVTEEELEALLREFLFT